MRVCKALQNSSANFGRRATIAPYFHRRYFADDQSQSHSDDKEATPPRRKKTNIAHEAIDWDNAFKVNPENKAVETAVGDLPLSPVMDPTYWEATQRYQAPKPKPGKAQNSVERQLRANPYAKALAMPVRKCVMTRVRLPHFFLQDFNLVSHPETGNPWLIPVSLMPDEAHAEKRPDAENVLEVESGEEPQESEESSENIESKSEYFQEDPIPTTPSEKEGIHGPAAYTLARQDLLSAFADKNSSLSGGPRRLVGSTPRYRGLEKKAVWRKDMDTYIRDTMRKIIISELQYICRLCTEKERHYIAKCYGWDDVQYKHRGSVLWFGDPVGSASSDQADDQPAAFASFDIEKSSFSGKQYTYSVAIYNMPMLLGAENASDLKEAQALRDGFIFMLAGRRTADLQGKLWKLQGYMADYID
ncbi:uncharacterized protein GGS22DRAFT_18685 [Annulohypoxylon maeteangense]|uniref:uncharacterized protein n=1 Tax=Annulohypoxylon maeteangense TaxID=1927788 RepID=UPI00200839A4|nr:uncharacterized protein GGS22DRAFT_18685 [Annulohypoxylon maeteangense]KAI0884068.1 hypothetical protein GGS22DRAFT_18685 [Annulohypoxylon maeteangense]